MRIYRIISFAFLLLLVDALSLSAWVDNDWPYRKEITILSARINQDLNHFPVLLNIIDADLARKAQPDGEDIVFTDDGDAILNHEIEIYDASNGHLVVWVNIPAIASDTNTLVYFYYGNPAATALENPQGVWDIDYVMVHHLSETMGLHYDSTGYGNKSIRVY
jgi:hypothetical protein